MKRLLRPSKTLEKLEELLDDDDIWEEQSTVTQINITNAGPPPAPPTPPPSHLKKLLTALILAILAAYQIASKTEFFKEFFP